MSIADIVMHPIRLRIIQYAAAKESFTVAELSEYLNDVPQATLYRHVKALSENSVLQTVTQHKVRGTMQQEYALNIQSVVPADTPDAGIQSSVYAILGKLMGDFQAYFSAQDSDPIADRLFLSINSLFLDDDTFERFIEETFAVVTKYTNQPSANGKSRMITIASSPAENEGNRL